MFELSTHAMPSRLPVTADRPSECRLCSGSQLECIGAIPAADFFAGKVLPHALPGGCLWRCLECESLFRHPILSPLNYSLLYKSGAAGQWSGDDQRLDLQAIRIVLAGHGGVRVLDVGCGNGDFLASLPAHVKRFGVELSISAADAVRQRGIHVVANTMEELPPDTRFDVITIIDVIEHLSEPHALLEQALAHLSDGGIIVVSTGDPSHVAWRKFFGSRFWYSSFPEHISFPSRKLVTAWARRRGAAVVEQLATRYRQLPPWRRAAYLLIQLAYFGSPRLLDRIGRCLGSLNRAPRPRRQHFSPGVAGLFVDHQVLVIRREPAR